MEETLHAALVARAATIRKTILEMLVHCGYGHLGGSMSIVEILAVLYGGQMRHDPANPAWEERDLLVLSKGHAGPALYATLALDGYFDTEVLKTLNHNETILPSHPDRLKTPGVDATTGSLGQGCSVAAGLAQGLRMRGSPRRVHLVVGDGELNEGQCWEAFQFIAGRRLDNVTVYIDDNKRQLDGFTRDILEPFDPVRKMEAFGFRAERVDGADVRAIWEAIDRAKADAARPTCIVLDTVKGQGVKYFEDMEDNHSVKFTKDDLAAVDRAVESLACQLREGCGPCGK